MDNLIIIFKVIVKMSWLWLTPIVLISVLSIWDRIEDRKLIKKAK